MSVGIESVGVYSHAFSLSRTTFTKSIAPMKFPFILPLGTGGDGNPGGTALFAALVLLLMLIAGCIISALGGPGYYPSSH